MTDQHKQVGKYINLKTQRLLTAVAQHEYSDVLCDFLIPEGNRPFQSAGKWDDNWQMHQVIAPPPHTATHMDFLTTKVPEVQPGHHNQLLCPP